MPGDRNVFEADNVASWEKSIPKDSKMKSRNHQGLSGIPFQRLLKSAQRSRFGIGTGGGPSPDAIARLAKGSPQMKAQTDSLLGKGGLRRALRFRKNMLFP